MIIADYVDTNNYSLVAKKYGVITATTGKAFENKDDNNLEVIVPAGRESAVPGVPHYRRRRAVRPEVLPWKEAGGRPEGDPGPDRRFQP